VFQNSTRETPTVPGKWLTLKCTREPCPWCSARRPGRRERSELKEIPFGLRPLGKDSFTTAPDSTKLGCALSDRRMLPQESANANCQNARNDIATIYCKEWSAMNGESSTFTRRLRTTRMQCLQKASAKPRRKHAPGTKPEHPAVGSTAHANGRPAKCFGFVPGKPCLIDGCVWSTCSLALNLKVAPWAAKPLAPLVAN